MARTQRSSTSWSAPSNAAKARRAARAFARTSARPARSAATGTDTSSPLRAGEDGEDAIGLVVRARDDVHRDDLARLARGDGAGVDGGLDRAHVAPHQHRAEPATDLPVP